MKKSINFLQTEAFRRTFLSYLLIALLFSTVILGFIFRDIHKTARENFIGESAKAAEDMDRKAGELVKAVDQFSSRIYSDRAVSEDFFRFFGATAEEYASSRLDLSTIPEASILSEFKSLVVRSNYSIRHIILYARENIVDIEFNDNGDSRHRIVTAQEADRICNDGCVYQKDIHQDSEYLGKISVVVDVTRFMDPELLNAPNRAMCIVLPGKIIPVGSVKLSLPQARKILSMGGFPKRYRDDQYSFYCDSQASQFMAFTLVYMTETKALFTELLLRFFLLVFFFILAFGAITLILIRRFSGDNQYITAILSSMERAEQEQFAPLPVPGVIPEYDAIIEGLNTLYSYLESLIHQEYKLTISQQKAEMEMLSTQLSPHFLYNTLERIRMRAVLNHDLEVAEATAGLGTLYRNIVKTEPVIPLKREAEITKEYLDLMSFLYGDEFMYYLDIDPQLDEMMTPKIWMQPIVENFFKHNFSQDDQVKVIVVEMKATDFGFEGRIFDNIGSIEEGKLKELNGELHSEHSAHQGIGLANVLHRLRLYYGAGLNITMENNDPAGVCIHIVCKKEDKNHVSTFDCR